MSEKQGLPPDPQEAVYERLKQVLRERHGREPSMDDIALALGGVPLHGGLDSRVSATDPAPASEEDDPGMLAVRAYHQALQIDEQWCVWSGRGFIWWGCRQAQRVWSEQTSDPQDPSYRVVVETDLVHLQKRDQTVDMFVSLGGRTATLNSVVMDYSRPAHTIRLRAAAFVQEDGWEWIGRLLQLAGVIQLGAAVGLADAMAKDFNEKLPEVGVEIAKTDHPILGPRTVPDEIVEAIRQLPGVRGWTSRDLEEAEGGLGELGVASRLEGTSLKASFGSAPGAEPLTLEVGIEAHPVLGPGLRMTLNLPYWPTDPGGRQLAPVELGLLEFAQPSGAYVLGSWTIDVDSEAPYFTSFFPNVLSAPGLLQSLVLSQGVRACWLGRWTPRS